MVPTSDNLWQKMADGGMTFRSRSTELPYMNIPAGNAVDVGLMLHDSPDLWRGLWREGEMACLFADTNLGKSILAVQMGNDVAHRFKRNVLYFDFEHSIAQFARRYSVNRKPFKFSPYFRRVNLREIYGPAPFGKEVVDGIERMVVDNRAAAIVIDNLTSVIGDVSNPRLVRRFIEQ
ncbi:MAG: AAA family ATPase, partial [Muribaculaceae bacterium]|nr:AAA family ATPase [Muribaculaceae bacterium]